MIVHLEDAKYTVLVDADRFEVLRYGKTWFQPRAWPANVLLALAQEVEAGRELRAQVAIIAECCDVGELDVRRELLEALK